MLLRTSLAAILALGLGIGFATSHTSRTSATDATPTAPAADTCTSDPDHEAARGCLPRNCGPIPTCTADSVPRCTPQTDCRWACVPINGPA